MIEEFSQIVGLLSAFTAGREAKKALDVAEFQLWLSRHSHDDIVELLSLDSRVNLFVKAYLNREIPEIQYKLDTIINLVQAMVGDDSSNEVKYSGRHYLKGMVLLGLERVIHSGLCSEDFEIAHNYICEMIGDHSSYNKYVLEKMIRDCLLRKDTASHVLNKYWLDLIA